MNTRAIQKRRGSSAVRRETQAALAIVEPHESRFMDELRKRLGSKAFVNVPFVAEACSVSVTTVKTWIDSGAIEARNLSVSDKPFYRIYAPSVLAFYERRGKL
jgi:hypothetical protein